ncbi:MAG: hypothetical protein V2I43_01870 [Parvularcula sp.]|jgi:hypothetical protein|nr:hypothetical protein [Parvularcula sp.]
MSERIEERRFLDSVETWQFGDQDIPDELAERLKGDKKAHTKCIEFMNECLDAHWAIWERVKDDEQQRGGYERVLTSGAGFGVNDFAEVLEALENAPTFQAHRDIFKPRRPYWTDRAMATYKKNIVAPDGFVNYREALDEKAEEFSEIVADVMPELETLIKSVEEKRWDAVQAAGKRIEESSKQAKMLLWYIGEDRAFANSAVLRMEFPEELEFDRKNAAFDAFAEMGELSKARALVSSVQSYAGLIGKIQAIKASAEVMVKLQANGGLEETEAAALSAMHYACGYVPILGAVYQGAIEWLADFLPQWRKLFEDRQRMLDDVVAYLYERERGLHKERQ